MLQFDLLMSPSWCEEEASNEALVFGVRLKEGCQFLFFLFYYLSQKPLFRPML